MRNIIAMMMGSLVLFAAGDCGCAEPTDVIPLEQPQTHGGFSAFAFAPDGKMIASGTGVVKSGGRVVGGGEVLIWDAATGKLAATLGKHETSITWAAFSQTGRVLATFSQDDGKVHIWNVNARQLHSSFTIPGKLVASGGFFPCLFLSPDGRRVFAASGEPTKAGQVEFMTKCDLRAWDSPTGRELWSLSDTDIRTATLAPDGKSIVAFQAKMVDVKDASSGSAKTGVSFRLADPQLVTIDTEKGTPGSALPISLENRNPIALFILDQGRKLAAGDHRGLRIWELESGKQVGSLSWDRSRFAFANLAFAADGKALIRTWSNYIERIDVENGKTVGLKVLKFPDMLFNPVVTPDLTRLAGNMSGPVVVDLTKIVGPSRP